MAVRIRRRSLFYWVRSTSTTGYWVEATTGGLATEITISAISNTSTTSLPVTGSGTNLIKVGDVINLGTERMYVTARSASGAAILTVERGYDGTVAVGTHPAGAKITIGPEAVFEITLVDALHNPRQATALLVNQTEDLFSSAGNLTDVFKPFIKILMLDKDTNQLIYMGYAKEIRDSYNLRMGRVLKLTCVDILDELVNAPSSSAKRFGANNDGILAGGASVTISSQIESIITDLKLDLVAGVETREVGNALLFASDKNTTEANDGYRLFDESVAIDAKDHTVSKGSWNILQHIDFLSKQDSHSSTVDNNQHMGYDFYASPYLLSPRPPVGDWTSNPQWHFNYFKRGSRPNFDPATYGLTVKYPVATTDDDRNANHGAASGTENAMRVMVADTSYVRRGDQIHTKAVVTYNARKDKERAGDIVKTKEFELLYGWNLKRNAAVSSWNLNNGRPIYSKRLLDTVGNAAKSGTSDTTTTQAIEDDNDSISRIDDPVASELLRVQTNSAMDGSGTWTNYVSATAAVARLQWISVETHASNYSKGDGNQSGEYTTAPTNSDGMIQILVSFVDDDVSTPMTNHNGLIRFVGLTSGFTIWVNNTQVIDEFWKGRPKHALGIERTARLTIMDKTDPDDIRKEITQALVRNTRDVRKGDTSISGFPYFALEARVHGTPANTSPNVDGRKTMYIQQFTADTVVNASTFGVKSGATIEFYDTDSTYITNNSVPQTYAYVRSITASGQMEVEFPTLAEAGLPADEDYVKIYIPLRAGDVTRVSNPLEGISGNHLLMISTFNDAQGGFFTKLQTVGDNEGLSAINLDAFGIGIAVDPGTAGAFIDNLPGGQQTAAFNGILYTETGGGKSLSNNVSWGNGNLQGTPTDCFMTLGDGKTYRINASNTFASRGVSGGVVVTGLSASNEGGVTLPSGHPSASKTVEYVVYLDTGDVPDADNAFSLHVAPRTASGATTHGNSINRFIQTSDRVIAFYVRNGGSGDAEWRIHGQSDGWNEDIVRHIAPSVIVPDSFTATLAKKTLQSYAVDIAIHPGKTTSTNSTVATPTALNKYIHATNISNLVGTRVNGSISFADNATAVPLIANNGSTDTATMPDLDMGSGNSTLNYIYFKLADSGNNETSVAADVTQAIIDTTTSYAAATSDSRGLLAIVSTGSDASADEVSIQAFHGKGQNITADVIAANAIVADAIKAGSLDSKLITLTGSDGKIRTGANVNSGSGDEKGIIFSSSGIEGFNADGTRLLFIDATTGTAKFGASAVEFTGTIAAGNVTGLAAVATGGSLANNLVTGFASAAQSAVTWDHIVGTGTNSPAAGATVGATSSQVTIINSNTSNISTNATNIGNKFNTADYLANKDINDISIIDPRLLGQGTLSATTVMAGQMAVGGHAEQFIGTVDEVASTTQIVACVVNVSAGVAPPSASEIINGQQFNVDGATVAGVFPGMYLELVEGSTREIMRVLPPTGVAKSPGSGAILVKRGQAGTSIRQTNWPNNTVCNNPIRQHAVLTQTGSPTVAFADKHVGGVIEYTTGSTVQAAIITGVTSTTVVSIIRASALDEPLTDFTTNVVYTVTHLTGARVEMSPAGIKGFNSSDAAQFEIRASDGTGRFAGGDAYLDSAGLTLDSTGNTKALNFRDGSNTLVSQIYPVATHPDVGASSLQMVTANEYDITFGARDGSDEPLTKVINFVSDFFSTTAKDQTYANRLWYKWPTDTPEVDQVLAVKTYSNTAQVSGITPNSANDELVAVLEWVAPASGGGGVTSIAAGTGISINQSTGAVTVTNTVTDTNSWRGIDDTAVDGQTAESISSNWAFDHAANAAAHHTAGDITSYSSLTQYKGIYAYNTAQIQDASYDSSDFQIGNASATTATNSPYLYGRHLRSHSYIRLSRVQRTGDDAVLDADGYIGHLASSERYKENIVNLTIDTAQIYNLTARNFKYKDTTEKIPNADGTAEVDRVSVGENSFGYIAEEVNSILPDLVGLDSDNQPNTVNYKLLSVLLLEELKKLKARVDILESA